ncbi:TonB-dependent receptor [Verrucomicrobiales bacterium]|nr:TonB-dependent receptor [Verrucomicrobiales bacterium]
MSKGDEQRRSLDQDRYLTYIQLDGVTDGFISRYKTGISHHRQEEKRLRIRKAGDGRHDVQGFTVDSRGGFTEFESETTLGKLTYGASYYLDQVDSFRNNVAPNGSLSSRSIQGPVADDSDYHLAGAFIQNHTAITDRLDTWIGGRFTYAEAAIGRSEDPVTGAETSFGDDWTNFVGSGRFTYDVTTDGSLGLFGGVSQGFRAPNLSDLSRLDSARSDEIETPSPGLDPEKYLSYEIGIRAQSDRARAALGYYCTDIDDYILGVRTGRIIDGDFEVTKINAGTGFVQGIELETSYDLTDSLSLFGWASWQDGELENEPISRMMPFSAQAGIRYQFPNETAWLEWLAIGATEQDELSSRDQRDTQRIPLGGTPGYVIGMIRGGWEITPGVTLTCAIENLTAEAYRVHGSGINAPGRNFIFGAEVKS